MGLTFDHGSRCCQPHLISIPSLTNTQAERAPCLRCSSPRQGRFQEIQVGPIQGIGRLEQRSIQVPRFATACIRASFDITSRLYVLVHYVSSFYENELCLDTMNPHPLSPLSPRNHPNLLNLNPPSTIKIIRHSQDNLQKVLHSRNYH